MDWFKICSDYYNAGFYDNNSLKVFATKTKITAEQYQTITGIYYVV
ncbi:XkdX family protein [Clostridium aciditolerans]|uniref:XkdX family protein n=1 Tax=Clostridium aciditolerans TaxID=339861 RepID=A0A934M1V6_9CLOT|nr:XkdX family protein [Clostridium aciditolerans]MBI6873734.1 XkdX family protein [Clostridium aciditolerans]